MGGWHHFHMPSLRQPAPAAPNSAPGVRHVKQQRSLQTQQALLTAGRELLKTHDLPALTVAQVAAAAGVAVGSFYSRFDDKNAWFAELARQAALAAVADLQHLLASTAMRRAAPARKVALLMQWLVQVHRDHQGIFRASVSDPARTQLYWVPLSRLCAQVDDLVYALLAPDLQAADLQSTSGSTAPPGPRKPQPKADRKHMAFALQMVFGTLVHAVLHDGGPVRLQDPTLAAALARNYLAAVGFVAAAAPTITAPAR